ncbi:MAG: dimethyl sulfoxide reductase anchor subunit [Alphaproteobacteria bacterium]|nr:MAG: dimethyl sulfoxide reductase anchor subunit [Alphaproteobacteria bacterium]
MHPAKSVIFFTTASGAGYGLLFFLLLGSLFGIIPGDFWFLFLSFGLAYFLITAGLLSSTFHLGHPERAWRALTQWRSSWLSREGVMAILTYIPSGLYAIFKLFLPETGGAAVAVLGVLGAIACIITVYCTAMIYASLKPVHAWANHYVPPGYLLLSAATGAVLVNCLMVLWRAEVFLPSWLAVLLLGASLFWKIRYWKFLDGTKSVSSPESATGLGEFGRVRLLEAPHTEANYLMKEMGFKIARKHAAKLRWITLLAGFALPLLLIVLSMNVTGGFAAFLVILSVASAAIGILAERWLFFAEARHTVGLYYGAEHA